MIPLSHFWILFFPLELSEETFEYTMCEYSCCGRVVLSAKEDGLAKIGKLITRDK